MSINELENNTFDDQEIFIRELLDRDGNAIDIAHFLLLKIKEAQMKEVAEEEVVSNYHTYRFSFPDDGATVEGLIDNDQVFKFRLTDFVLALQKISKK